MNIIIEGPDNAGKSTLARALSNSLGWFISSSKGPEKYPGEIDDRVREYLKMDRTIFDRHTVVSNYVYSNVTPRNQVLSSLVNEFYATRPLFIYCRAVAGRTLETHEKKAHDTDEFLKKLEEQYPKLCEAYDDWALHHATMTYRIGDDMRRIIRAIEGAVS